MTDTKEYFLIFVLCVVHALCSALTPNATLSSPLADKNLATYLLQRQPTLRTTDADTYTVCFNTYLPQLQNAADEWAAGYNECIVTAASNSSELMEQMIAAQEAMNATATEVCVKIDSCQSIEYTLEFFNCFAELGPNQLSTIYAISANASENAAFMQQQTTLIEVDMYRCTNATQRQYVETTAGIYDELDNCLLTGGASTATTTATANTGTATATTIDMPASSTSTSTTTTTTTAAVTTTSSTLPSKEPYTSTTTALPPTNT